MITKALRVLFPNIQFPSDCLVSKQGNVEKIVRWSRPEPQPTNEELVAAFALSPVPGRDIAKLTIRRRLRDIGKEEAFDAALDVIPHARKDYDDATTLNTADPIFTTAAPLLKAQLNLTDEQFTALLAP